MPSFIFKNNIENIIKLRQHSWCFSFLTNVPLVLLTNFSLAPVMKLPPQGVYFTPFCLAACIWMLHEARVDVIDWCWRRGHLLLGPAALLQPLQWLRAAAEMGGLLGDPEPSGESKRRLTGQPKLTLSLAPVKWIYIELRINIDVFSTWLPH